MKKPCNLIPLLLLVSMLIVACTTTTQTAPRVQPVRVVEAAPVAMQPVRVVEAAPVAMQSVQVVEAAPVATQPVQVVEAAPTAMPPALPTPTAISIATSAGSEEANVVCGVPVPYSGKTSVGALYVTKIEQVAALGQYDHSNVTVSCLSGTDKFMTRMSDVEAGNTYEFECYWWHPAISFSNYLLCNAK